MSECCHILSGCQIFQSCPWDAESGVKFDKSALCYSAQTCHLWKGWNDEMLGGFFVVYAMWFLMPTSLKTWQLLIDDLAARLQILDPCWETESLVLISKSVQVYCSATVRLKKTNAFRENEKNNLNCVHNSTFSSTFLCFSIMKSVELFFQTLCLMSHHERGLWSTTARGQGQPELWFPLDCNNNNDINNKNSMIPHWFSSLFPWY